MSDSTPLFPKLKVIWENSFYLVIDKPSGLISAPSLDKARANALSIIGLQRPEKKMVLPHRLDRDTSGVLLFLHHEKSRPLGNTIFGQGNAKKTYLAILSKKLTYERDELVHFLKKVKSPKGLKSQAVFSGGDKALLSYQRVSLEDYPQLKSLNINWEKRDLVEVLPTTGRYHQIRAQFAAVGNPLLGDHLYGGDIGPYFLHALSLGWHCPLEDKFILVRSPPNSGPAPQENQ